MTVAVCYKCGAIKHGALVLCPECLGHPETEDDMALSLAMTDHYFDLPTLERMGEAVREGEPPRLDPATHAGIVAMIRQCGMAAELKRLAEGWGEVEEGPRDDRPPRRSWWRFW